MPAHPDLVLYVREQMHAGVPADVLRDALMEAGWIETDIDNALHDVAANLQPVSAGASLHEDLAQVRGMVAHLASRVHSIESHLASTGTVPLPAPSEYVELPTVTKGPDHMLSSGPDRAWVKHVFVFIVAGAVVAALANYVWARQVVQQMAHFDQIMLASAIGAGFFVAGYVMMRRHRAWLASLAVGSSLALWSLTGYVAWRIYAYMEWSTALALGLLMIVLAVVMGRWVERYSHK